MRSKRGWLIKVFVGKLLGLLKLLSPGANKLLSRLLLFFFALVATTPLLANPEDIMADTIEVKISDGFDIICTNSDLEVEITGLDSGVKYDISYEITGADSSGILDTTIVVTDSIQIFIVPGSRIDSVGIDTLYIRAINNEEPFGIDSVVFEILPWPEITKQPEGREICINEPFDLSVSVNDPSLLLQWEQKKPDEEEWEILTNNDYRSGVNDSIFSFYLKFIEIDWEEFNPYIDSFEFRLKASNGICEIYTDIVQIFVDTTPPTIIYCPKDTFIELDGNECMGFYDLSEIADINTNVIDNCKRLNDFNPDFDPQHRASDPYFPMGTTTVIYTAQDANKRYSRCKFSITVIPNAPPLICPDPIVKFIDQEDNCGMEVYFKEPNYDYKCLEYSDNITKDTNGPNDFYPVGITEVNRYFIKNHDTIAQCSFPIEIKDTIGPNIICPGDRILNTNPGESSAFYKYDLDPIDPCGIDSVYFPPNHPPEGSDFSLGYTKLTYGAIDVNGNKSVCTYDVIVRDLENPIIDCPDSLLINLPPLQCDTAIYIKKPDVYDSGGIKFVTNSETRSPFIDKRFSVGSYPITWTVVDSSDNQTSCEQTIRVFSTPLAIDDLDSTDKNVSKIIYPLTNDEFCSEVGNMVSLDILVQPSNGVANVVGDDLTDIEYEPNYRFFGEDSLTYQICSEHLCATAKVFITVNQVHIPIQLMQDTIVSVNGGSASGNILINDIYTDDCPIDLTIIDGTGPNNSGFGNVSFDTLGNVGFTPNSGFFGVDSFMYRLCDYLGECDSTLVFLMSLTDTDFDGIADLFDADDDADGIPDEVEERFDSDNDGIPNHLDIDADNDGIPDNIEGQQEGIVVSPSGIDEDADGLDDAYDTDQGGTSIGFIDTDGDTYPDFIDEDSDDDQVLDVIEGNDSNMDAQADVALLNTDSDNDGLDDAFDQVNGFQNQGNEAGSNVAMWDTDNDGVSDWRDPDDDGDQKSTLEEDVNQNGDPSDDDTDYDNMPNYLDALDNCDLEIPNGFSPNGDGIADKYYIKCIHNYPNAKLEIFNRWGQKIYVKEHYGNTEVWGDEEAWWDGTSTSKMQIANGILPSATYIYVLDLGDGSEYKTGTIYLNRDSDSFSF